jgi:hypothetical protein
MVYVLYKFTHYLLGSHLNMHLYQSTLKYLVNKMVLGGEYANGFVVPEI